MKLLMIVLLILYMEDSIAFEVDGFKSGMSIKEAKKNLEGYSYENVKIEENHISAWDYSDGGINRLISLSFCNQQLVQLQKHLKPRFDFFVRLVEEKRKEIGQPLDAWANSSDLTSNVESNAIKFLWKVNGEFLTVSFTEFTGNNQMDITYEIYNKCWKF